MNSPMSPIGTWIGLKGYRVIRSQSKPVLRAVVEPEQDPTCCTRCGGARLHSKGRYRRRVKHLRSFGSPVQLVVECRRFQCLECRRSFVQPLPRGSTMQLTQFWAIPMLGSRMCESSLRPCDGKGWSDPVPMRVLPCRCGDKAHTLAGKQRERSENHRAQGYFQPIVKHRFAVALLTITELRLGVPRDFR